MRLQKWHTRIDDITLHHAGIYFNGSDGEAAHLIQSIRRNHRKKNWGTEIYPAYAPDISYHAALNPKTGRVFYLNDINSITWHDGSNNFSIGVLVLGDGNKQEWNKYIEQGLEGMLMNWEHYGINKLMLRGHRDIKATNCPGDNYYKGMMKFKFG